MPFCFLADGIVVLFVNSLNHGIAESYLCPRLIIAKDIVARICTKSRPAYAVAYPCHVCGGGS